MKKIIICILTVALITACKKTEPIVQPKQEIVTTVSATNTNKPGNTLTVTTTSVNVSSAISANPHGNVTYSGGGSSIAERGFCYSTTTGPTISNDTVRAGSGVGNFAAFIRGLTPGTTYYVRAYAIKSGAVYYGNQLSFTTLTLGLPGPGVGVVYDIDGNSYNTISYGTQVWMVENLKTTRYRDGSLIPAVTDNTAWAATTTGAYCDYDNIPANSAAYGRLYNQYAVIDARNIAPAGWHVPSSSEWSTLSIYLGGAGVSGGRMKEAGFTHWLSPNTAADNSSGFTAVGAGGRTYSGTFFGLQTINRFWATSSSNTGPVMGLSYDSGDLFSGFFSCPSCYTYGFSVRCVKD